MKKKNIEYAEMAVAYILSIENEGFKNLEAKDVAAALNIGLIKLSLIFKKVQKISLSEFIKREKFHRSFYILNTGREISIIDLSESLGFTAPGQFEKEFTDYFCINPGELKEINKDKNNRALNAAPQRVYKRDTEPLLN